MFRKFFTLRSKKVLQEIIFEFMKKFFPLLAFSLFACTGNSNKSAEPDFPTQSSDTALSSEAFSSDTELSSSEIFSSSSADPTGASGSETEWNKARLTNYESYPDPGSEECIEYNGCQWAGYFAALDGQQTEEWVKENNIIAVHEKDFETYKLKTFRLRKNGAEIDAVVYDMCSDSDCDGCCTKNAGSTGFLIDIEINTMARFNNYGSGIVEWKCLDCDD